MDLIIFADNLYHLIPVTKSMLVNLEIPKGVDCFDLCEIITENFKFQKNHIFYGCICGAEAPQ